MTERSHGVAPLHGRSHRAGGRGVRGRPPTYSRRYHLTLEPAEADLLDAYAEQEARPTATVAARLLTTELRRVTSGGGDELGEATRQLERLRRANAALRSRLNEAGVDVTLEIPRWELPVADLLGDREWWTAWLPRLYQLLGRQPHLYGRNRVDTLDDRGYPDLMTFLFPPARDRGGRVVTEWHSPPYAEHSMREWETGRRTGAVAEGPAHPGRPSGSR